MAYHLDETELVIDGWEEGISDNPYKGINDMRGVNIISIPGEASVAFKQTNMIFPSVAANVTGSSDVNETLTITVTSGTLVNGQAVTFAGASLPTNVVAGTTYWILKVNSTTIKLYEEPTLTRQHLIGSDGGTGTMTSINMSEIVCFERNIGVALDDNGRAWWQQNSGSTFSFLGNKPFSTQIGGVVYYKGYLFLFLGSRIDHLVFTGGTYDPAAALTWVNEWNPSDGATDPGVLIFRNAGNPRDALLGQDDVIYITDGSFVDSLFEKAGQTFDPATPTTYTWNGRNTDLATYGYALKLPSYDTATCLEELGVNLMVGGSYNYIYPWNRTTTSFNYPIKIADNYTYRLLTVNTNMYIFAGRRGRIYMSNSSQANLYKKVPDHILGVEPIFSWKNVCYNKNQIYFGFTAKSNDQIDSTSYVGLWAIDITTDAMRVVSKQSTLLGIPTAIYAYNSVISGFGLATAWVDYSTSPDTYGIDMATSEPYSTFVSYIETDLIPVGQFLKKRTFENLEFKLSTPMVNGEGIKISYRTSKTGSYIEIKEFLATATYLPMSDYTLVNFDQSQWLQLKVEMKSTASSPSYVRLKEIRLR